MRGFVKKTLAELMKTKVTIAASNTPVTQPANQAQQPQGNRHTRRRQMMTLQRVQKRLATQGINMEMGPVSRRELSVMLDDTQRIDYASGPDRSETIIAQVSENGQILALVPDDEVEAYLAAHPGAKVQPRENDPVTESINHTLRAFEARKA